MPNRKGCSDTSREKEFIMWNVECGTWNVECGTWNVECGMLNAAMREFYTPTDRTEEHRCHAGCLPITDCAIGAADEHGFFAGGVQLICGDR